MWALTNEEFTGLMQQYQKLIYTVCLQFVHEPHTAEDLTQDTFLSAFSAIDRCEPQYYKQWLVRVAANKCKDHLKSAWVRKVDAVMYFLEHKESSEIAKLVGRPPATINSQLWRAKLLLRQQITERRQNE